MQCGFYVGYFSRNDIEHWADKQIENTEKPSLDLIDLAILRGKHDWDVISLLFRVSSDIAPQVRTELTIGMIGKLYREDKLSLKSSVRTLLSMMLEDDDECWRQYQGDIYCLDDGYDLAVDGTYGTIKDVETHLLTFTEPFVAILAESEPLNMKRFCETGAVKRDREFLIGMMKIFRCWWAWLLLLLVITISVIMLLPGSHYNEAALVVLAMIVICGGRSLVHMMIEK